VLELWETFDRVNLLSSFPGRMRDIDGVEDIGEWSKEQEDEKERKTEAAEAGEEAEKEGASDYFVKGDQFPLAAARAAADSFQLHKYSLVVMLGLNVAKAFRAPTCALLDTFVLSDETKTMPETVVLVLPHPSGVSHFWNAGPKSRVDDARTAFRCVIRDLTQP
jgi:hypothetical protein